MYARVYRRSALSADPKIAALAAETSGKSETPQMPDQLSNAFIFVVLPVFVHGHKGLIELGAALPPSG